MSQATARVTIGALFGTVVTTAETVTGVLNTVSNGVAMLNNYVESAAKEQRKQLIIDDARSTERLIIENAKAEAMMQTDALKFRSISTEHAELFDQARLKYAQLLGFKVEGDDSTTQPRFTVAAE